MDKEPIYHITDETSVTRNGHGMAFPVGLCFLSAALRMLNDESEVPPCWPADPGEGTGTSAGQPSSTSRTTDFVALDEHRKLDITKVCNY